MAHSKIRGLVPYSPADAIAKGTLQSSRVFNAARVGLELSEPPLKNEAPFTVFRFHSPIGCYMSYRHPDGSKHCNTVEKNHRSH